MKAFLLLISFPLILTAQTPAIQVATENSDYAALRDFGDTIHFEAFPSGTTITDQYLVNGAMFSGYNGSGNPVTYDYGASSWTSTLHSDDWYNPLKLKFVSPLDSTVGKPVSKLSFLNPIASEIDYIKVVIYDNDNNAVASYLSTSPEWVSLELGASIGSYAVFDDSAFTAYVIDRVSFIQAGEPTGELSETAEGMHSVVFPNPFNDQAALMINPDLKLQGVGVRIFNNLGKQLKEYRIEASGSVILNRRDFSQGLYLYQITSDENKIWKGSFIVQ